MPRGYWPPPGLCRIWIDGVPPGRQPGVTDCAYAYTHVPRDGRVLYGGRPSRRARVNNPYYYGPRWPIAREERGEHDDDERGAVWRRGEREHEDRRWRRGDDRGRHRGWYKRDKEREHDDDDD